jgi:SAM-dependent methyltransferase
MVNKETSDQRCITQCENPLDQSYWEMRWQKNETGWDIGYASPAITEYMQQYPTKNAAILIPGCGNAYEAEFLIDQGFTNITLIDISPKAVDQLKKKFEGKNQVKVLCEDFFTHEGKYDLIIEQTFFCAIPPFRRAEYFQKSAALLNENGKITGLMFDKQFNQPFPPFGGCPYEYKPLLNPFFEVKTMEKCNNSIPPRKDSEIFIILTKK